jgi:hypothetical protein
MAAKENSVKVYLPGLFSVLTLAFLPVQGVSQASWRDCLREGYGGPDTLCASYDFTLPVTITTSSVSPALTVMGGKVGVGTASPTAMLTVSTNSASLPAPLGGSLMHLVGADGLATKFSIDSYGASSGNTYRRSNGTAASPLALQAGDQIGAVNFAGHNGSAYTASRGYITGVASEAWTSTANGTALVFATTANGSITPAERARVADNGNVGIGLSSPLYKLDVAGEVNAGTDLRVGGVLVCTPSGCVSSSDEQLKRNIAPLGKSLERISALHGVSYEWKDPERYGASRQIGFIAQEVERVFPEVVRIDADSGMRSVSYDHLLAPVVEAIKELEAENARLRAYLCAKDPSAGLCERN